MLRGFRISDDFGASIAMLMISLLVTLMLSASLSPVSAVATGVIDANYTEICSYGYIVNATTTNISEVRDRPYYNDFMDMVFIKRVAPDVDAYEDGYDWGKAIGKFLSLNFTGEYEPREAYHSLYRDGHSCVNVSSFGTYDVYLIKGNYRWVADNRTPDISSLTQKIVVGELDVLEQGIYSYDFSIDEATVSPFRYYYNEYKSALQIFLLIAVIGVMVGTGQGLGKAIILAVVIKVLIEAWSTIQGVLL